MEVRFSEWAEICLKEIYDHYSEEASPEKASEIVNKIIDRAETLDKYPDRGRVEDDLISLGKGHRYLLEFHYKIIYKVDSEIVIVTDIFSNYQKPAKKPKRNK
ncbi:type II toxin-antitoxin system RelE/ParE family toxin [Cyclobacterium plantarum]|uniref:type II toxin-antitoxin system RelE/ParE family toxin n=1 Tax=Cyclobacterium plantarum TaxID=2716263 RepID=UPI003F70B8E4